MKENKIIQKTIAITGNPNSGKSTVFNALTGLSQKTGNFPGVTVERHIGSFRYNNIQQGIKADFKIIDLPGTYSVYPKSLDESETAKVLLQKPEVAEFDILLLIADATNMRRSLALCTQVMDLGHQVVLVVNMIDLLDSSRQTLDTDLLSQKLGIPVIALSAKENKGIQQLKSVLATYNEQSNKKIFIPQDKQAETFDYFDWVKANSETVEQSNKNQQSETIERFKKIDDLLNGVLKINSEFKSFSWTRKLDYWFTHRIFGFLIFIFILAAMFQAIFAWAEYPMDLIDGWFTQLSNFVANVLPPSYFSDLISQGIIPGLGGILMFIPQITLLFTFIAILEDTGYMARVSFIMDRLMRGLGINGRSVIPLISGVACAVPAIMSARTIKNYKERLITILITPLMSCSARLPVYILLIAIAIPEIQIFGFINAKGLILLALYLVGFLAAIFSALLLRTIIKSKERSYFIMELPIYRKPKFNVVLQTIFEKVKIFVIDVGKVIIAIAIVLWFMASFGPPSRMEKVNQDAQLAVAEGQMDKSQADEFIQSEKLKNSYAGILGHAIEPVIAPLGFDWKIGIALITSFAAREVFVGTMATIYNTGDDDQTEKLQYVMKADINPRTGLPLFTIASSLALMLFYAFAMQCMSTIAVVKRETGGWKWPIIQFFYMGLLAYGAAFTAYQLMS